jgi:hypothetical protein
MLLDLVLPVSDRTLGVLVPNRALPGVPAGPAQRHTARRQVSVAARLTWRDQGGAVRFASVTTRDLSDAGAFVECAAQAPIPLFRLVHLQLERAEQPGELPAPLRDGRVLAAVWRIERAGVKGADRAGYALRFLVDPTAQAGRAPGEVAPFRAPSMAVAS